MGYNMYTATASMIVRRVMAGQYVYDDDRQAQKPGNSILLRSNFSVYSICGESEPSNEACVGNVGVNELEATEANLYPNPARDQITIEAVDMTRLHIVNYVGQVVYDQEFDNVSSSRQLEHTANYQSGVYVARIYTEKGVSNQTFRYQQIMKTEG